MKKIALIIGLLLCSFIITGLEINKINAAKDLKQTQIVILNRDLKAGEVITSSDLSVVKMPSDLTGDSNFYDKFEIEGNTLALDMPANTVLVKEMIIEHAFFVPESGNGITAIKLNPEEAMCWAVNTGESVIVHFVDLKGEVFEIGEVFVKGNFDQSLSQNTNHTSVPVFLLIEGKYEIVQKIIASRNLGRIEIVKKSEN